jgi:Bacterial regulatory protein, Fis family
MSLTKKEVCKLLGISPSTLTRRMAAGRYKFTRTGEGQYAEVSFTHADIGLPEPVVPVPEDRKIFAEQEPVVTRVLSVMEISKEQKDADFAERYLAGEVPDSAGNYVTGVNPQWPTKGIQSLLGPMDAQPKVKPDTQAHMDPALQGVTEPDADICRGISPSFVKRVSVDSDEFQERLHPGFAERQTAMYRAAGIREPSPQAKKQVVDRAAILAAFEKGFSR